MYIYKAHMGSLYTSNEELEYEDLHCKICGESDTLLGFAETRDEVIKLLGNNCSEEYIKKFLDYNFD